MSVASPTRPPRRLAALGPAVLALALLAPAVLAVEARPPVDPDLSTARAVEPNRAVGSVRPRGAAAPVQLRPPTPIPQPSARDDDGDGVAGPTRRTAIDPDDRRKPQAQADRRPEREAPSRVWPMEKGSYAFTQAFGCVPQLGDFYRVDPGCPPGAPAVHTGIDLGAREGELIYAAASGWVTEAGLDREVGLANTRIVIQHDGENDGYATEYLHWIATYVREGDYVRAGEPIAEVGSVGWSTGPHLHFAVTDFSGGDYIDPVPWLPDRAGTGAYRGVEPGRKPKRIEGRSIDLPDYADPAPPPAPRRERVPAAPPPAAEPSNGGGTGDDDRADRERREQRADRRDRAPAERAADDAAATDPDGAAGDDQPAAPTRDRPRRDKDAAATGASAEETAEADADADADADDPTAEEPARDRGAERARDRAADDGGRDRNDGERNRHRDRDRDRNDAGNGGDRGNDRRDDGRGDNGKGDGNGGGRDTDDADDRGNDGKDRDRGRDKPPADGVDAGEDSGASDAGDDATTDGSTDPDPDAAEPDQPSTDGGAAENLDAPPAADGAKREQKRRGGEAPAG